MYFRYNDNESVMVVINNNSEKQTIKTNRFKENTSNFKAGIDVLTGKSIDLKNDVEIESRSVLILELK